MNSMELLFPEVRVTWDGINLVWDPILISGQAENTYEQTSGTLTFPGRLYYQATLDLSAYFVQDKTFFPLDVRIQEPGILQCQPVADWANACQVEVLDLISSVPLDADSIAIAMSQVSYPGFSRSNIDNQFILYGRYQAFSQTTTSSFTGLMQLVKSSTFGAGLPTATDKLYCLRVILPTAGGAPVGNGAQLEMGPTRYMVMGEADVESELARIYRLRQSFEQRQQDQDLP